MASTESNKNIPLTEEVKINTEIDILNIFFPTALGLIVQGYTEGEELVENMKIISKKNVSFCEVVNISILEDEDEEKVQCDIKTWDGSSYDSILYASSLYDFMSAPRHVSLNDRYKKIEENLKNVSKDTLAKFIVEANYTIDKLHNPLIKKIPLWSKGGSHEKVAWSIDSDDNAIVWLRLFLKGLENVFVK